MFRTALIAIGLIFATALGLFAQPIEFTHQGRLLDADGVPITTPVSVFFSLWQGGDAETADSGFLAYSELETVTPDATGIFSHQVGTGTPLDATLYSPAAFDTTEDVFLQIAVGTQANVLLPRALIVSTPYAVWARLANESLELNGQPGSHYLDLANHTGSVGVDQLPGQMGSIWLPAWTFAPDTRHGSDPGEIWSLGSIPTLVFPPTGQTKVTAVVSLPADFSPGPITFNLIHVGDEAPTPGNDQIRWTLRTSSLTTVSGPSLNSVFSTITTADEAVVLSRTTSTSLDVGDAVAVQIFRNAIVADDTYESDVEVLGLRLDYTRVPLAP